MRSLAGFLLVNGDAKLTDANARSPRESIADMMQRCMEMNLKIDKVLKLQKADSVSSLIVH